MQPRRSVIYALGVTLVVSQTSAANAQVLVGKTAQPALQTPALQASSSGGIEEIVVTANRREERIQSVPISITAITPQRLEQQNITKGQDLAATVPSLVVGPNGQASRDTQSFTIRGQGATFEASPGVVVYLNEVPLPASFSLSQQGGPGNFVDLESVQVLAGPQGTLFGRNTTGGAVLLVPRKPTSDFDGFLEGKYGNYQDKELQGAINIPVLDDKLMIRVAGAYQDRNGYTRDLTYDRDLDNQHWYSGRVGILLRPTERLENYTMAYGAYSRFNGTGIVHIGFNIPFLAGYGLCSETVASSAPTSCDAYRRLTATAKADGPRAVRPDLREMQKTETWGIENTTKFALTDELALRDIVSYQRFKSYYFYDADGTPAQQYDASYPTFSDPRDYYKSVTEELQLQGNFLDNRLVFTAGGFYYDQRPAGAQGADSISYCPLAYTGFCAPQRTFASVKNESKALYAQGTFDLGVLADTLARLKLTGGYRYTWDRIDGFTTSWTPQATGGFLCANSAALISAANDPYAGCLVSGHLRSHAPTWTVGLDYKLGRSVLLFAKASRGYKAGGFNEYSVHPDSATFAPEHVTSYEGGIKSDLRAGMMPIRINVSYYYSRYSNIQRAGGDFNVDTKASGARIYPAKARIQGVEAEATIKPSRALEIGGIFSYTDARYTHFVFPSGGQVPDCSGSIQPAGSPANLNCLPFQYVSPYIFAVHGDLDIPLGRVGELDLYANYAYNSAQYTDNNVLPAYQPGDRLPAYGLLNLSLDLRRVGGTSLDAGLFITNATNKLYRISNNGTYNSLLVAGGIYGEPRMYGLRVRYQFK